MDTKTFKRKSDYLSRCKDSDDWSVEDWVFQTLNRRWGPHTIDRFASYYNCKCPRYNSRWWVPGTEGVNSLDQYWGLPEIIWAVPPPRLIPSVLEKVQKDHAVGTRVIPEWLSAPFILFWTAKVYACESKRLSSYQDATALREGWETMAYLQRNRCLLEW